VNFVGEAIESVLGQKHLNIEFLITDDGSKDGTVDVIKKYDDPRICYIENTENRGACIAYNELITKASGDFICIMNSDDVWHDSEKISKQIELHNRGRKYGAVFSKPNYIDKSGDKIEKKDLPLGGIFDRDNRDRCSWLEELFMRGNCLCHPSVMIRKECYDSVGLYNNIYRQLPDYDMWIRILKKYEIFVMDENLISFRIIPGENTSSSTPDNVIRFYSENYLIRKGFFNEINADDLKLGFNKHLKNADISTSCSLEIEKALLFINQISNYPTIDQLIGYEKLSQLHQNDKTKIFLDQNYKIDASWLHAYSATMKLFHKDVLLNNNGLKNIEDYITTINEQAKYISELEQACSDRLELIKNLDKSRIDLENIFKNMKMQ
jgi:glycosyltransferase involved in cell wall biosynthesis